MSHQEEFDRLGVEALRLDSVLLKKEDVARMRALLMDHHMALYEQRRMLPPSTSTEIYRQGISQRMSTVQEYLRILGAALGEPNERNG